jgi:penicillin amidase
VHSNASFSWRGYIPFDELPFTYNPPEGFIVTANNKVTPSSYPYTLLVNNDWEAKYRATRIRQMIESNNRLTLQDMRNIQYDEMSLLFQDFKAILEKMEKPYPSWRDKLLQWDGYADVDSVQATVFQVWCIQQVSNSMLTLFDMELSKLAANEVGRDHWSEPGYLLTAFLGGTDPNCVNYQPGGN